jgi:hypothetical protein
MTFLFFFNFFQKIEVLTYLTFAISFSPYKIQMYFCKKYKSSSDKDLFVPNFANFVKELVTVFYNVSTNIFDFLTELET